MKNSTASPSLPAVKMAPDPVFRSFHRARWHSALRVRLPVGVLASAIIVMGVWGVAAASLNQSGAAAAPDAQVASALSSPAGSGQLAGGVDAQVEAGQGAVDGGLPPTVPAPAGQPVASGTGVQAAPGQPVASRPVLPQSLPGAAPQAVQPAPVAPTPLYSIAVTARGHQAELDACQWVRMDVGAIAPIVGAHNFCHGDIILSMAVGDVVTVTGTELDGDYQVTGSRDARAGDAAEQATAGLTGDIIFQTCYWESSKGLRLVTAIKVDLSLPPIVVG